MDKPQAEKAVQSENAFELANSASADELTRLKLSEELFELRYQRQKRTSRFSIAMQSVVGLVAVGGFFANAFQAYVNKQQQQHQQQVDQERWTREFERAQRADKYRAFFETSALVTDENNPNKRLVGYALLTEFVQDPDYNGKTLLLLEEALTQELRRKEQPGQPDVHQVVVTAILAALSQSTDCRALEKAAKSVDRIAAHRAEPGEAEEAAEIFQVYVRKLLGPAALRCSSFADFRAVRRPLVTVLEKQPELAHLSGPLKHTDTNQALVQLLRNACAQEVASGAASDCGEIFEHYGKLCQEATAAHPVDAGSPVVAQVIDAGHPDKRVVEAKLVGDKRKATEAKHTVADVMRPEDELLACALVAQPLPQSTPDAGAPIPAPAEGSTGATP